MTNSLLSKLLMLGSSLCIALYSIFTRESTIVSGFALPLFARFLFSLILVAPFAYHFRCSIKRNWKLHCLRAVFVVLGQYAFFYYISKGSLLKAVVLYNTAPLYIPIITYILFGQSVKRSLQLALCLSFIGIVFIINPGGGFTFYASIGLIPGFTVACSQIFLHKTTRHEHSNDVLASAFNLYLWSMLLTSIPTILLYRNTAIVLNFSEHFPLFLLISLFGIGNQLFRGFAYRLVDNLSNLVPYWYTVILFSGILDWFIYNKIPTISTVVGILLTSIGILWATNINKQ